MHEWERILNIEISFQELTESFSLVQKTLKVAYSRYIHFKILHDRLNTRQLLYKMKVLDSEQCIYCKNVIDTTIHALIECPCVAILWRQVELWLRENVENTIKLSEKEKIWGYQEFNSDSYLINVVIFTTKLVIYKRRPCGSILNLKDVLHFMYTEMINDEYECEMKLKQELFENRWAKIRNFLLAMFA